MINDQQEDHMKTLKNIGAIISLSFLAAGLFQLWRCGLTEAGMQAFFAASVTGFVVSAGVWLFDLRARLTLLEKQTQASQ